MGAGIGGLLGGIAYQNFNAKYIQCVLMIATGAMGLIFPYTNGSMVYISRLLTGFC